MDAESNRREFLKKLSLTAGALAAGASVASLAGCQKKESTSENTTGTATQTGTATATGTGTGTGSTTTGCAHIDEDGCLFIDDKDLASKLYDKIRAQEAAGKPQSGAREGVCVRFYVPGSPENKLNSLCNC